MKKIHFIGIGWIGISALARYYKQTWYEVSWSDSSDSELLHKLQAEWIQINIWEDDNIISPETELVVYSEAIITKPDLSYEENLHANKELNRAIELGIKYLSYPKALAEVVNSKKLIAIAGSHGKSTTTSFAWLVLQDRASTIVGTQVPQFGGSNLHYSDWDFFVIEACEYKRSFLNYKPKILVITNIDLDHLDYYKDLEDYVSAFREIQDQTCCYVVLNGDCENSKKLADPSKKQIWVYDEYFIKPTTNCCGGIENSEEKVYFPKLNLQVPGKHIEFDAKLAYVVGYILGLEEQTILDRLNSYSGIWRRSEVVKTTKNGNILMSDYGHHPLELKLTLWSIKEKYKDKKLFVVFQPHQHSRTIKLLEEFKKCFDSADKLVIPNIYFSRDSEQDVKDMTTERFVNELSTNYPFIENGNWLDNTLEIISKYDRENPNSSVIVLAWAWNVDNLRFKID